VRHPCPVSASRVVRAFVGIVALGLLAAACGQGGDDDRAETGASIASPPAADHEPQVYEGTFTVLQSDEHGPSLCTLVLDSDPPQCGDLPVLNWDWDAVEGETTSGATTWGMWHLTGTYSRDGFTLTEPPGPPESDSIGGPGATNPDFSPACDQPDAADVPDGSDLWLQAQINGSEPVVPDEVTMWQSQDPFVLNLIVRPGSGPAATAALRQSYAGPLCVVERDLPTEAELHALQDEVSDSEAREALGPHAVWSDGRRGVVVAQVWALEPDVTDYAHDRWGDRVELQALLQPVDA
jgi:hypothetical protein